MSSLDIWSAFNQVPIHKSLQKFMCFEWNSKFYKFQCLAQGATCSPRYFVKITTPIMKYLRRRMVATVIYIDDTILLAPSADELRYNMHLTISTLEQAGFLLNYEKSILEPCTKIKFLGFDINSVKFQISLTQRTRDSIFQLVNHMLTNPNKPITIRHLGKIIGKIVATFACSESAPLHYGIIVFWTISK